MEASIQGGYNQSGARVRVGETKRFLLGLAFDGARGPLRPTGMA